MAMIAAARVGTQPLSLKCRICGRPSLRGTKLCDQCVAAVKRARHVSTISSQFLPQPLPGAPVRPQRHLPHASLRRPPRWSWLPTKPGGWGILIAFALFAAAVVGTAYLAIQESADRGPDGELPPVAVDPSAARTNLAPPPSAALERTTGAADSGLSEGGAAKSPESLEGAQGEGSPTVAESAPADKLAPRKAAAESPRKPVVRTNPAHSSEVSDESRVMVVAQEPVDVAPPPAQAPAPEPVVPDRWETMNAALAACSRESFLAGVMCTERVRYEYCEGFWGQVPQCRAATRPGSTR